MEEKTKDYFHEVRFIDQEGQVRTTRVPVVQELARQGLNHLPERFISVHPNNPPEASKVNGAIKPNPPSINIARLRDQSPEVRALELTKLASGAKDWGLFLITEHGISPCVLDGVREVVKGFFGLSFEEKKQSVGTYSSTDNLGYGRNFVKSEDQPLDWIDRLAMKAAPEGADEGLNVWPQKPANFRQVIEKYVSEARNILDELLEALAEALSLDKQVFLKNFDPNNSEINVRVNYYPPCPMPDMTTGITPHSDVSALTLLTQFGATDGLQVLREEEWLTVAWPEETLVVNVGELLEIMSNGRLKSPWHRAVTQKDLERFSVALFYRPNPQVEIEPAKEAGSVEEGYKKVVTGEYVENSYRIGFRTHREESLKYARA